MTWDCDFSVLHALFFTRSVLDYDERFFEPSSNDNVWDTRGKNRLIITSIGIGRLA